ncbi:MAG: signal transduction histidine kinase [Myxococcota bacterium]|jgi:signal transduction histidine kinase
MSGFALEDQHRLAVESAPTGIMILDADGSVLMANPAAARLLRSTPQDMLGRQLTLPDATNRERLITPDERVLEMRTAPILWDGQPALVATLLDITDTLQVNKLQKALDRDVEIIRQLRELDRARKQFIEMATHELRTPMTPMRSAIQMLLSGQLGTLSDQQQMVIEVMSRNVERLSRFSTDMLSLSRLDSKEQTIQRAPVNLMMVIRNTAELFQQRFDEAGVQLRVVSGPPLLVWADADALSQVLVNLLENALVHASPTEVKVSIKGVDDVWAELLVRDNGCGIRREDISTIFKRFRQLNRKRGPGYQGSGLGLALCKELAERMDGQIVAESTVGKGTRFRVRLCRVSSGGDDLDEGQSIVLERPSRENKRQRMREILLRSKKNRDKPKGN